MDFVLGVLIGKAPSLVDLPDRRAENSARDQGGPSDRYL